jgi:hypothetical protein
VHSNSSSSSSSEAFERQELKQQQQQQQQERTYIGCTRHNITCNLTAEQLSQSLVNNPSQHY